MKRTWKVAMVVTGAAGAVMMGGPTSPPPGPVTSQYKTLTEVEPRTAINAANTPGDADSLFKITQPGSYYLTGNITGMNAKIGIEVAASGVSIDLMGFELAGVAGSLDGIRVPVSNSRNISISNGSVRNWSEDGVDAGLAYACTIADVSASNNTMSGIRAGAQSILYRCRAFENGASGMTASQGSTFSACAAGRSGQHGIVASITCAITECTSEDNTLNGIDAGTNCSITGCSVRLNDGRGISGSQGCTISGCTATTNTGSGISGGQGSTILGCSSFNNTGVCIEASNACTIADCTAIFSATDAIRIVNNCTVRGNTCNGTNAACIHATGTNNRIEANNCGESARGIDVDSAGNVIIRNICSDNLTNWDVVAGNVCLVVTAATGGAILGNAGGAAPGSTDPNANFSY